MDRLALNGEASEAEANETHPTQLAQLSQLLLCRPTQSWNNWENRAPPNSSTTLPGSHGTCPAQTEGNMQ